MAQSEQAAKINIESYDYPVAIRLYEQALKAVARVNDRTARRRLLHQLGQVYYRAGNYKQAMRAHQDELTLLQESCPQTTR